MTDRGRVPALDGVRGVAICLVVLLHAGVVPGGWVGVSLFFALSGYLITSLLLAEHDRTGTIDLRAFYWRRFARLAPALVVALAAMCLLWSRIDLAWSATLGCVVITLTYMVNIVRAFAPVPMLPVAWAWSLSLEEQFYAIWPLLLRKLLRSLSRRQIAQRALVLAVLLEAVRLPLGAHHDLIYNLPRGDELILGACLALVPFACPRWLTIAGVAGLIGLGAFASLTDSYLGVTITAAALCSAIVVASAHRLPMLTASPLCYLGRISYSLYLWNGVLSVIPPHTHRLLQVPVALGLAVLSTHLLEEPLRRRLTVRSADHRGADRVVVRPGRVRVLGRVGDP